MHALNLTLDAAAAWYAAYCVGGLFVLLLSLLSSHAVERFAHRYAEKWPPISKLEFLLRCSPAVDPAVALRVRQIIADNAGVDAKRIHPEMSIARDLG